MTSPQAGSAKAPHIDDRTRRTARRLLSGAGSAAVTAYRIDPSAPSTYVAHALSKDGRVLVAACPAPGSPLAVVPEASSTEVRVDITLDAAEPGVRITAATAHLLGHLTWVSAEEAAGVLGSACTPACRCAITGEDPLERLAQVAGAPGGRLGIVTTERVMLHCVTGVSSHTVSEVLGVEAAGGTAAAHSVSTHPTHPASGAWNAQEVLAAHEAVSAVGQLGLRAVCDAVRQGEAHGWVCSSRPSVGVCASLWDRILCVDVDMHGATLMHITGEEVTTLVVAFSEPLQAAAEAGQHLEQMAAELLPRRLARP
ncbi:hypothetical protein [Actinomyces sp. 2119]|uniref:hypothetical protein n=1 Tax=Actinomyces sp. 2119 TaxID=2321393 RepID=UPI00217593AD|nr:hypothetical protein [Actinomyces sp. 2119]